MYITFATLSRAQCPDPAHVALTFRRLFPDGIQPLVSATGAASLELRHGPYQSRVTLIAAPLDETALAQAAARSLACQEPDGGASASHVAHLQIQTDLAAIDVRGLTQHWRVVAACAESVRATATYLPDIGVAHPQLFVLDKLVRCTPPTALWIALHSFDEGKTRRAWLGTGLRQLFGLPDVMVIGRRRDDDDTLDFLFDVMDYMLEQGRAPRDGDTIGHSATERRRITRVPSPIDPAQEIVKVDLTRRRDGAPAPRTPDEAPANPADGDLPPPRPDGEGSPVDR